MAKPDAKASPEAKPGAATAEPAGERKLTPEAKRALAEAEARRQAQCQAESQKAARSADEIGGRQGPDPVRFGDWEKNGIISDF